MISILQGQWPLLGLSPSDTQIIQEESSGMLFTTTACQILWTTICCHMLYKLDQQVNRLSELESRANYGCPGEETATSNRSYHCSNSSCLQLTPVQCRHKQTNNELHNRFCTPCTQLDYTKSDTMYTEFPLPHNSFFQTSTWRIRTLLTFFRWYDHESQSKKK